MLHHVRYVVKCCNSWKWGWWGNGGLNLNPPPPWGSPYPRGPLTIVMFHVEQCQVNANERRFCAQ